MSRIVSFPQTFRRRAALLDYVAETAGDESPEEREFVETLRRIVAGSHGRELFDRYHGGGDRRGRLMARYAD